MPHPEVALHPIYGPDGSTAMPVGHPMHRAGDEALPDTWGREFVDEMVAGGYAGMPAAAAETDDTSSTQQTAVLMTRPARG
jgi:hypothetical protein